MSGLWRRLLRFMQRHLVVILVLVMAGSFAVYEFDEVADDRRDDATTARLAALIESEVAEEEDERVRLAAALARTACEATADTREALAATLEAAFQPVPVDPEADPSLRRQIEAGNQRRAEDLARLRAAAPLPTRCEQILAGQVPAADRPTAGG